MSRNSLGKLSFDGLVRTRESEAVDVILLTYLLVCFRLYSVVFGLLLVL